ncbi:MAG: thioesterase family protein [Cyanobacteria bacterium]|nr:thioesterase family protein [Cyanobacteriota bacterium]
MPPPLSAACPWLQLQRTVRFGDTDAAGVMHFHQLLRWCHEGYEESLQRFGIAPAALFPTPQHKPEVALPIVHCRADFRRPLVVGDELGVVLTPTRLDPSGFEVAYRFVLADEEVARGLTRHLAINATNRQRCPLPDAIQRWLEAAGLGAGVQPV